MIYLVLSLALLTISILSMILLQLLKTNKTAQQTIHQLNETVVEYRIQLNTAEETKKQAEALAQSAQNQFKVLANDILEEKAKRFTEQNQVNLSQLLTPLQSNIQTFQQKLEEMYKQDIAQQATLQNELRHIKDLNSAMTKEAHELATALKGHAKQQGTWGETVLGNVLECSGLREGKDFETEKHFSMVEGNRRPDVVVRLPQNKHLIIDAKVSLNAYLRYVRAEDEATRKMALDEHVRAISDRIKELSDRDYFKLPGLNSPEMVFMFIPIESAFVEALRANDSLFQKAIEEQHVLVTTPTTLLTSLNIVKQLWRFEEQNTHTKILAEQASKFHQKLTGFLENLLGIGQSIDKSKEIFDRAMGQFYCGKNNLIKQAKALEKLGVSVQKKLPEELVDKAAMELTYIAETSGTKKPDGD
ncbi:MAG: DNA recombination protein RmuC [Neisseriales bacterium]|nr:MAG: DNA recombination protein RmuC [Neisseriales bacterium]